MHVADSPYLLYSAGQILLTWASVTCGVCGCRSVAVCVCTSVSNLNITLGDLCVVALSKKFSSYFDAFLKRAGSRHACSLPSTGSVRRRVMESQKTKNADIKPFTRVPILVEFKTDTNAEKKGLQLLRAGLLTGINLQTCRAAFSADSWSSWKLQRAAWSGTVAEVQALTNTLEELDVRRLALLEVDGQWTPRWLRFQPCSRRTARLHTTSWHEVGSQGWV